jgi:SnoaL-like domain
MAESRTKLTPAQKIEKARQSLDDLNRGEVNPQGFAQDVVWHGVLVGELRGRDAVAAGVAKQRTGFDEFRAEPHAILADDEHTVALVNLKVRAGGKDINAQQVIVLHTNDQGQISEMWSMLDADALKQLGR